MAMRLWVILAACLLSLPLHAADDVAAENARLKRENAALKAENAKLKEDAAKAKGEASPPKAKRMTLAEIVNLIPKELRPDATTMKWDGDAVAKVKKILEAHLAGEWVEIAVQSEGEPNQDDAKAWRWHSVIGTNALVNPFVDCLFAERPRIPKQVGANVTVAGKVKLATVLDPDKRFLVVVLTDCRIAK